MAVRQMAVCLSSATQTKDTHTAYSLEWMLEGVKGKQVHHSMTWFVMDHKIHSVLLCPFHYIYIMLILVPGRRSGTNSCKIASARSEFYAICHLSIRHVRQSSLYVLYCFFLSFCYAPKRPSPFSLYIPHKKPSFNDKV